MPDEMIEVTLNTNEKIQVAVGSSISEILKADQNPDIVGALINNTVVDLHVPVLVPIRLTPIYRRDKEGHDIAHRTCTHMMDAILAEHYPNLHFLIGQSLHDGYYYELLNWKGEEPNLGQVAQELDALAQQYIEDDLPIISSFVTQEDACVKLSNRPSATKLLRTWPFNMVPLITLGNFTAIKYGPVAPSTRYCKGVKITFFPKGFIMQFSREAATPNPEASQRLFAAYRESRSWNRMINVATVGDLNDAILHDRIKDVIMIQEGLHEQKIVQIAADIAKRRDQIRLVCIAGPSSSGKTTFVRRLSVQLRVLGINPVIIGMDDYYRDREETPLDENGKMDFEAFEALDVPLLTQHLEMIAQGKEIRVPRFDFPTGRRVPEKQFTPVKLGNNEVLLIEGIHGLNPRITESVPAEARYRVFVSALTQLVIDEHNRIPTSDGRLLRRIVRDHRYRGTSAAGTIAMWPGVRAGEERNIFPFQEQCDAMFNSTLVYEPAVFKTFAQRYLLEVSRDDPAWSQASSLLRFLDLFVPMFPDYVPSNSVMREFIGGSHFTY